MLKCINGGGFSTKCKSRMKVIRSRIDVIKRKKNATLKYLKKDIAELLQKGLDADAYGRVEGLINEANHAACYDLIEKFCVCILEQLSSMKKQRECPAECTEAVSSLMFAAARFADLPELCDLRSIFTDRYGHVLDSCVNHEFSVKIASKPASMEQKLQLMRDISHEFALNWDPKTYKERKSNPPLALTYEQPKLLEAAYDGKDQNAFKTRKQDIASKQRLEVSPISGNGARQVKTGNKMNPSGHNNNVHQLSAADVSGGRSMTENVKPHSADNMVPHARQEVKADKKTSYPFNSNTNKQQFARDLTREPAEGLQLQSAENMAPPYLKAKDSNYISKPEIQHPGSGGNESANLPICYKDDFCSESLGKAGSDFKSYKRHGNGRPEGRQDEIRHQDNPVGNGTQKPRSMRKQPKPPGNKMEGAAADRKEHGSRTPNGKTRQRAGLNIVTYLDEEEEMYMDELLMHYSKKPSLGGKSKTILTGQRARAGQKAPIYSIRDAGKSNGSDSAEEAGPPPPRALSLPPESTVPTEVSKVPFRAASLQNPNSKHVHPKLPDYDDLVAALREARGVKNK